MHEMEIEYFMKGLSYVNNKFYIDAIEQFKKIITEFPDSELCDDAEYNIALCYFELNDFKSAIQNLNKLIQDYPDATITVLGLGIEFGRTIAKSYLLMINCYLALGQLEKSKEILTLLERYSDSYVLTEGKKVTYYNLGRNAISLYELM
jgi:tetratricopeptide (TPR) repeat protein